MSWFWKFVRRQAGGKKRLAGRNSTDYAFFHALISADVLQVVENTLENRAAPAVSSSWVVIRKRLDCQAGDFLEH